ncbi:hypothetical protein [Dyadobacter sp. 3J3]|uniref:hypothetical protein n=1 Tax=Dyadobacter sp. 3J3 TaxID=2606600 RepID=UPI00135B5F50|nr:hypothetical protein [Dyadobacter sp. 3J3]
MTNISESNSSDNPKRGRGRPKISDEKKAESAKAMRQRNPTKQIPETIAIHSRFFQAYDTLLERHEKSLEFPKIKSTYEFVKKYAINHGNFTRLREMPERYALPVIFIYYLVNDYSISAQWILTGNGEMFEEHN